MKKRFILFFLPSVFLLLLLSCSGTTVVIQISDISLSAGTLTPEFDSSETTYTATVPNSADSIDVTVTVEAGTDLTVSINGDPVIPGTGTATIQLDIGDNTISIVVSYEGETETYTVTVSRESAPEINIVGPTSAGGTPVDLTSGTTIDFGYVYSQEEITFRIENAGSADLTLTGSPPDYISITGNDPLAYSVTLPPDEAVIPPGGFQEFAIEFSSDYSTNTKTAIATIESDDDDEGTFTLSLTGFAAC